MTRKLLHLALALLPAISAHADPGAAADEAATRAFERSFGQGLRAPLVPALLGDRGARLALDAAENLFAAGDTAPLSAIGPGFAWRALPPAERVRWYRLTGFAREEDLAASLAGALPAPGLLYELLRLEPALRSAAARATVARLALALPAETAAFRALKSPAWAPPPPAAVRALFTDPTDVAHFAGGAYAGKPRLFLFCRHDRNYPCLLALKDGNDQPVRDGAALWTQPGLGLSGYGKPFNERLGNTPQGVQLVDSVMPEANDLPDFGRFRRMILEFPPASVLEAEMRRLLPAAASSTDWWKESAIARDVGRGELRIHGTGDRNDQPTTAYYPFLPTIGCVAQRELKYGDTDYIDQRQLLDRIMQAQGLEPRFENEPAIRALLYVIDLDDRKAPVAPADLARFGIQ